MKLRWLLITVLSILVLAACQPKDNPSTPTGYGSGEIDQPQIMYNDAIYYYNWTGFDEKLPENYVKVGTIVGVSNVNIPEDSFCGAQVELGR